MDAKNEFAHPRVILAVCEDNDSLSPLRAVILERFPGWRVLTCGSPEEGLRVAEEALPDGLLVEAHLPALDGPALCRRFKANPATAHLPVMLVLPPDSDAALRVQGLESGASYVITKSADTRELAAKLKAMMRVKAAEDDLRAANRRLEERYRILVETTADLITLVNGEGCIAYVNPTAEKVFGLEPSRCLGMRAFDFIHPEDRAATEAWFAQCVREKREQSTFENRQVHRATGAETFMLWTCRFHYDEHGQVTLVDSIGRNITERKQAEAALQKSEEQLRIITETIGEVFWMADAQIGEMFYVSSAYERIWGRPVQELYAAPRSFLDAVHPDDLERVRAGLLAERNGEPFQQEYRIIRPDGSIRWILDRGFPVAAPGNSPQYYAGIAEDITDRKLAEQALSEANQFSQQVINSANEGVIVYGPDLRYQAWNPYMERMSGLPASAVLGRHPLEVFPFLRETGLIESLEKTLRGERVAPLVFPGHVPETGIGGWALDTQAPLRNAAGEIIGVIGTVRDITDLKRTEHALRESEARFRAIADHTPDYITVQDAELRYRMVINPQLGLTEADMLGKTHEEVYSSSDAVQIAAAKRAVLESGSPVSLQTSYSGLNGEPVFLEGTYVPTFDASGQTSGLIGYFRDITGRKKADEQLQLLKQSVEMAPDGAYWMDRGGHFFYVNEAACNSLGYTRDELMGLSIFDVNPAATPEGWAALWEQVKRERTFTAETVHRRKDGTEFPVEITSTYGRFGEQEYCNGFARDISERKRAEQTLLETEERLRLTAACSPVLLWMIDWEGRILYASLALSRTFQYTQEEAQALTIRDFVTQEQYGRTQELMTAIFAAAQTTDYDRTTVYRIEVEHKRKDGTTFWAEVAASVLFSNEIPVALVGTTLDVTERRQAEAALRESEEKYRMLFEEMLDGFALHELIYDAEGSPADYRFLAVNPAFERMTGLTAADTVGRTVLQVLPGTERNWVARYAEVVATGTPAFFEDYTSTIDKYFQVTAFRPAPGQFACLFSDVTARRLAEKALRESEAQLRAIHDRAPVGIAIVDSSTGHFLRINPSYCAITGYSEQELLARDIGGITHPSDRPAHEEEMERLRTGQREHVEADRRLLRKDGNVVHVQSRVVPLSREESPLKQHLSIIEDVTQRKKSEVLLNSRAEMPALLASGNLDQLLQAALDRAEMLTGSSVGFFHFVDANQQNLLLQTWSTNTLRNMCTAEGQGQHYPVSEAGMWADALRKRIPVIHNDYASLQDRKGLPPGHAPITREAVVPLIREGLVVGIMGVGNKPTGYTADDLKVVDEFGSMVVDYAIRLRSIDALRRSEERYRVVAENTYDWEYWIDPEGRFVYCSPSCVRVTGYTAGEFERNPGLLNSLLHPDDRERVSAHYCGAQGNDFEEHEFRIITRLGEERWVGHVCRAVYGDNGAFFGRRVSNRDITERKRAELERNRLISAIEQAAETIVITDAAGTIQYANPAFEQVTGYARASVLGKNPRVLKSGVQDREFYARLWNTLLRGETWRGQFVNRKKNGDFYTEDAVISPVRDGSGNIVNFVAVKRDITEQVKLEDQLRQSQKMEAIGVLAGGIAHDFNNILSVIIGFTEISQNRIATGNARVEAELAEVLRASERARELVGQILAFSRQRERDQIPVRISTIIKEAVKFLRSAIPSTISIRQHLDAENEIVLADPTQIHQVMMNLCTNAWHAMEEGGGELGVTLMPIFLTETGLPGHPGLQPGEYVELTVTDTGYGIEKAVMDRIFDPYFTTKGQGKGTGMGLAVVHGIVTGMGGAIAVESEPGKGSRFSVVLPTTSRACEENDEPSAFLPQGAERVLFVDDEDALCYVTGNLLLSLGYLVTLRSDGSEALEAFLAEPEGYDLLITDFAMPKMNGAELSKRVLAVRDDLPIILCTGYSQKVTPEEMKAIGIREVLLKPVRQHELAEAIRRVLDESGKG